MIIVSITGASLKEAQAQVRGSVRYADMFEFRLDLMKNPDPPALRRLTKKPVIATCRPVWEGGGFDRSETERKLLVLDAAFSLADYIDIELMGFDADFAGLLRKKAQVKVLVSHHIFGGRAINVKQVFAAMRATGADVVKLAYEAGDAADLHFAFDFLARAHMARQRAVAIAMGEHGQASRILYKKLGGWATYAAAEIGDRAADGQLKASELKSVYRADKLRPHTKVFAVIGNPLQQSKGVYIHNPLLRRAKRNAVYVRMPVISLTDFIRHVALLLSGFSVTIPHKREVMEFLDEVDPGAEAIGAVNTVVRRKGEFFGINTDAPAALDAIERAVLVRGKKLLVLGAGGAARAIARDAKRRGAEVFIANRTAKKARQLAKEFGVRFLPTSKIEKADFDVFVNATSVGMFPKVNVSPIAKRLLKKKVVFDAVYNPPVTKLMREGRSVGATIIAGTEMYISQAARQCELYYGIKPNLALMRKMLHDALRK